MKIFANKEIKKLFLAVSVIWVAFLLLTQGFLWLCYQRFSLFLLLVFVLSGGAILAVGCSYFKKQNQAMEQAISQINAYLDGDHNARIECDDEGELYRLFHTVNSLAAVLNAHADNELREKEFLENTISDISHQLKTPLAANVRHNTPPSIKVCTEHCNFFLFIDILHFCAYCPGLVRCPFTQSRHSVLAGMLLRKPASSGNNRPAAGRHEERNPGHCTISSGMRGIRIEGAQPHSTLPPRKVQ